MGKRVGQSARSVISPDSSLHVNEVGVPREIAERLTYPERVYKLNMKMCQALLEKGDILRIRRGENWINAKKALFTNGFKLQFGDKVLRNGQMIDPYVVSHALSTRGMSYGKNFVFESWR